MPSKIFYFIPLFILFGLFLVNLPTSMEDSRQNKEAAGRIEAVLNGTLKLITVDGQLMEKPEDLFVALKEFRHVMPTPSHSRRSFSHVFEIRVESSTGSTSLTLHRTTEPNIYWVGDRCYRNAAWQIGFVKTSALDGLDPGYIE